MKMKKVILILAVLFFIGLSFISCRTTQDCPAYGQNIEFEAEELA